MLINWYSSTIPAAIAAAATYPGYFGLPTMGWTSIKDGKLGVSLGVRLAACVLVGVALVFVITSSTRGESDELSQNQFDRPEHSLLYNAAKIARGLEETNRKRADDVVISYTREDKILAGFQKAVKERDAKFRSEVENAAKESEVEERATQRYDNNGDPDDPHFKTSLLPVTKSIPTESPFELEKEEKSQKVQSHIDHEVEEITGDDDNGPSRPLSGINHQSQTKHLQHKQDHKVTGKTVVKPERAETHVIPKTAISQANLARYLHSEAFKKARAGALLRAEKAMMAEQKKEVKRAPTDVVHRLAQPHVVTEKVMPKTMIHVNPPVEQPTVHTSQNVLPVNLENFAKQAPNNLQQYMKSEAYRRIREHAEHQSEQYYLKHERNVGDSKEVHERNSAERAAKSALERAAKSALKDAAMHKKEAAHSNVRKFDATAAEAMRHYMSTPQFKEMEAHSADHKAGKALLKVSHVVPVEKQAPAHSEDSMAAERAELEKYISGASFKKREEEQASKVRKLAELHNFMDSKEFRQKEAVARSRIMNTRI